MAVSGVSLVGLVLGWPGRLLAAGVPHVPHWGWDLAGQRGGCACGSGLVAGLGVMEAPGQKGKKVKIPTDLLKNPPPYCRREWNFLNLWVKWKRGWSPSLRGGEIAWALGPDTPKFESNLCWVTSVSLTSGFSEQGTTNNATRQGGSQDEIRGAQ